jgi:hypothetical protein
VNAAAEPPQILRGAAFIDVNTDKRQEPSPSIVCNDILTNGICRKQALPLEMSSDQSYS